MSTVRGLVELVARHRTGSRAVLGATMLVVLGCGSEDGVRLGQVVTVVAEGASNPTVAVGRDGAFYVAWVGSSSGAVHEDSTAGADVWLARSADGVRFSAPVRVNDIPGDAAPHEQAPAQVAAGADGEVVVVWQNNTHEAGRRFPYSDVRLARSVDGGRTFAPAITVNDDAAGPPSSHTFHDVAIAPGGDVLVSWIDSRVRTRLELSRAVTAESAAEAGSAAAAGSPAAAGSAAAAESGMHAGHASGEDALPGPEIRLARSVDGGVTFDPSLAIAAEACPCCRTSLDVSANGEVAVAWRGAEGGSVRDIMLARTGDGAREDRFKAPAVIHADGWRIDGCPHAGPALAFDPTGGLHAAWYTGAEGREGLYYAAADADGRFGEPVPLFGGSWAPVSQVKLAAVPAGVILVWEDRRSEERTITVGVAERGQPPRPFARGMPGASPALGAADARAGVAWLDGEAVRFAVVDSK